MIEFGVDRAAISFVVPAAVAVAAGSHGFDIEFSIYSTAPSDSARNRLNLKGSEMKSISIFAFCKRLDERKQYYTLSRTRDDAIVVTITIVGGRIEVDFFEDGHLEYSIFKGDESVLDDIDELMSFIEAGTAI
jgi:hypothetical protein